MDIFRQFFCNTNIFLFQGIDAKTFVFIIKVSYCVYKFVESFKKVIEISIIVTFFCRKSLTNIMRLVITIVDKQFKSNHQGLLLIWR